MKDQAIRLIFIEAAATYHNTALTYLLLYSLTQCRRARFVFIVWNMLKTAR